MELYIENPWIVAIIMTIKLIKVYSASMFTIIVHVF